jgi:hypothetical protein
MAVETQRQVRSQVSGERRLRNDRLLAKFDPYLADHTGLGVLSLGAQDHCLGDASALLSAI